MSGSRLPKTGLGALTLTLPAIAGLGGDTVSIPMPLVLAGVGVALVVVGAIVIRATFRRRRPAGVA